MIKNTHTHTHMQDTQNPYIYPFSESINPHLVLNVSRDQIQFWPFWLVGASGLVIPSAH